MNMVIGEFNEFLNRIDIIKDVVTDYDPQTGTIKFNITAVVNDGSVIDLSFRTHLNMIAEGLFDLPESGDHFLVNRGAVLLKMAMVEEDGAIFKIKTLKRMMTISEVEDRLGFKIEIIEEGVK